MGVARRPRFAVSTRAAFLDRDGVINELSIDPATGRPESPLRSEDVALIPGAAAALAQLSGSGWLLVGVTNQPAAAKGTVSQAELDDVHMRVLELLAVENVHFDAFLICPHHPEGVIPDLAHACDCRKPAPGMLLDAADQLGIDLAQSWMIGDTDSDVLAGARAGCRTVLIEHPRSVHKRTGGGHPDMVVRTLEAAAALILASNRVD